MPANVSWTTFTKARQVKWTTDCESRLIFNPEGRYLVGFIGGSLVTKTTGLVQVAARIEVIVIMEPECGAVILIRSTFGNRIENRTAVASIFRAELVRYQSYFLDQIRVVQLDNASTHAKVVVVLTIEQEVVGSQTTAV